MKADECTRALFAELQRATRSVWDRLDYETPAEPALVVASALALLLKQMPDTRAELLKMLASDRAVAITIPDDIA